MRETKCKGENEERASENEKEREKEKLREADLPDNETERNVMRVNLLKIG